MKHLAIVLVAVTGLSVGLSQMASAADMPAKAPVYQTPVAAPVYNWNGFYVGGNVGWGWAHDDARGFYRDTAGGHVAGQPAGSFPFDMDGLLGGGQIGFNYMAGPHVVLGIEGDFSGTGIKTTISKTTAEGTSVQDAKIEWLATVRGRAGYAINQGLVYATGGGAWAHGAVTNTQVATFGGGAPPGTTESYTTTRTGWTAGGGVEVGLAPNWTAKVEYLYLDFGNATHTLTNFDRVSVDRLTMNVVRLG